MDNCKSKENGPEGPSWLVNEIADYFIDRIEKHLKGKCDELPWVKPWRSIRFKPPINGDTERLYSGLNSFLLLRNEYRDHRWFTANQMKKLNMSWKGESPTYILKEWVKKYHMKDSEGKLKYDDEGEPMYWVSYYRKQLKLWNYVQVVDNDNKILPLVDDRNKISDEEYSNESYKNAEEFCSQIEVNIINRHLNQAWYNPSKDMIQIPNKNEFKSIDEYYSTLFHELAHWTGHKSRLNRVSLYENNEEKYAFEELVAELTSAFLCQKFCLNGFSKRNNEAYLQHWAKKLSDDPKAIIKASNLAQVAYKYLCVLAEEKEEVAPMVS